MDEVAARAAVSKQTLYKQFEDKQHLFAAIILDTTVDVVDRLSEAVASTLEDAQDVRAALRDLAAALQRSLLQPEVLKLRRLVIAEADRFPEVGRAWFEQGFHRAVVILGQALQRLADRGLLRNVRRHSRPPARRGARAHHRLRRGRLPRRLRLSPRRPRHVQRDAAAVERSVLWRSLRTASLPSSALCHPEPAKDPCVALRTVASLHRPHVILSLRRILASLPTAKDPSSCLLRMTGAP
jgi:AcrR family transcriptional regulator